jgi:ubiquinone/menaquinone biosynthesis C-methylase UbiE
VTNQFNQPSNRQDLTDRSASYLSRKTIHQEWLDDYLNPSIDSFYDLAFSKIISALDAKPGDKILDAGCGYCYHASRLASAGLAVTGVDFSAAALTAAKENLAQQGLEIDLREGNILDLPFEDESFPFVNCWGVLMHIPEVETALSELARVLKTGGRLALMENNHQSLHVRYWERGLNTIKKTLGRKVRERNFVSQGIEEWRDEGLMVRKLDIEWLTKFYTDRGLKLVARLPGQFTEAYTAMPSKLLKKLIYRWNYSWLSRERSPKLAMGNILVFEKLTY